MIVFMQLLTFKRGNKSNFQVFRTFTQLQKINGCEASLFLMGERSLQKKIFHTLVGWVGLKKSFSIQKIKKHGQKMPKIALIFILKQLIFFNKGVGLALDF